MAWNLYDFAGNVDRRDQQEQQYQATRYAVAERLQQLAQHQAEAQKRAQQGQLDRSIRLMDLGNKQAMNAANFAQRTASEGQRMREAQMRQKSAEQQEAARERRYRDTLAQKRATDILRGTAEAHKESLGAADRARRMTHDAARSLQQQQEFQKRMQLYGMQIQAQENRTKQMGAGGATGGKPVDPLWDQIKMYREAQKMLPPAGAEMSPEQRAHYDDVMRIIESRYPRPKPKQEAPSPSTWESLMGILTGDS